MTLLGTRMAALLLAADIDRLVAKERREFERQPFTPPTEPTKWRDEFDMLCLHCERLGECEIIERMIEMKDGGPWPEGGWVTDAGAGVTCLSYQAKSRTALPRQQLRAIARTSEASLPAMCGGCAARKGSEASVSLHTQRDFAAAVRDRAPFTCHEDPTNQRLCGGWCRAIKAKAK